jgi:hypothetical protein
MKKKVHSASNRIQFFALLQCPKCVKPYAYRTNGIIHQDYDELLCRSHPGEYASVIAKNLTSLDVEMRKVNGTV